MAVSFIMQKLTVEQRDIKASPEKREVREKFLTPCYGDI